MMWQWFLSLDPTIQLSLAGLSALVLFAVVAVVDWEPTEDERAWMDAIDLAIRSSLHRSQKTAALVMGTTEAALSRALRCAESSPLVRLGRLGPAWRRILGEILIRESGGHVLPAEIGAIVEAVQRLALVAEKETAA